MEIEHPISFYSLLLFLALDERNTTLELLEFGYGCMKSQIMNCNLPPALEELVQKAKEISKFKLEFQEVRRLL